MTTNVQDERRRFHAEAVKALQALVTHYAHVEKLPVISIDVSLAEDFAYGDDCTPPVIMAVIAEIRTS